MVNDAMVDSYSRVIIFLKIVCFHVYGCVGLSSHGTNLLNLLASQVLSNPVAFLMCEWIRVHIFQVEFCPHLCSLALCFFTSWVMSCECLVAYLDIVMHLSKIDNSVWRWMTIALDVCFCKVPMLFCNVFAIDVLGLFKAITSPWQWTNLI